MILKEREKTKLLINIKKLFSFFYRILFNRKTKIILLFIFFVLFFLIGVFSGLLIRGFFGTLNQPSQITIDILHAIGITNLKEIKVKTEGIMKENIKIPFNYLSGQFSNPEKIFIDIGFKDFQTIELKRKEALKTALHVATLLNCKIIPLTQIMRKTVIDGSNTSGFQRTVLIAEDGFVETQAGKVGIQSVCLEEDSARIVNRDKGVFKLDRLGIPLVEIATDADIKSPGQAREAALHIGEILRSLKVRRGIGICLMNNINKHYSFVKCLLFLLP